MKSAKLTSNGVRALQVYLQVPSGVGTCQKARSSLAAVGWLTPFACWVNASSQCVKCGIVGGVKTTVPCSTCNIPQPYVYRPAPPPTTFGSPPTTPSSPGSPPPSPPSSGGGRVCHYHVCCEGWASTPTHPGSVDQCWWSRNCSLAIASRDIYTRMSAAGLVFDDVINNGVPVRCECLVKFKHPCNSTISDSTSITSGFESMFNAQYN